MVNPLDASVKKLISKGKQRGRYICPALAPFHKKIHAFLFTGPRQEERIAEASHPWKGGPLADAYLRGKYLDGPAARGGKAVFADAGKRFRQSAGNQRFLAALRFTVKGKASTLKELQELFTVLDCMVLCKFGARNAFGNSWENMVMLVNAATGREYTADGLKEVGERVWTLERMFNLREGFSKEDDTLPDRLFDTPIHDGPSKGAVVSREDFMAELEAYYALWGWSRDGVPEEESLKRLDLPV